jgi:hypothetical protein
VKSLHFSLAMVPLVVTVLAPLARAQESVRAGQQVSFTESRVEIFDAVGTVTLRRATGNAVTVTATAQGADGGQLTFAADRESGKARFRVVFPDVDAIASPGGRDMGGTSELNLRRDGTFGGDDGEGWRNRRRGDQVRVGGSRGFHGAANLEIGIPDGREVKVHLAVGHATVDGVNGTVVVDTWGADAEATNIAGDWLFDTGSGDVTVRGARGTLKIDTGSGSGTVSGMSGDLLDVDTGSGDVDVSNVQVDRFRFDTGSGDVIVRDVTARRGVADTGSGSVSLAYAGGTIEDLLIDTGSGRVNLTLPPTPNVRVSIDTGSGETTVQRAGAMYERRDSDGAVLRFGEGRGRIRIDTGSGDVTIR